MLFISHYYKAAISNPVLNSDGDLKGHPPPLSLPWKVWDFRLINGLKEQIFHWSSRVFTCFPMLLKSLPEQNVWIQHCALWNPRALQAFPRSSIYGQIHWNLKKFDFHVSFSILLECYQVFWFSGILRHILNHHVGCQKSDFTRYTNSVNFLVSAILFVSMHQIENTVKPRITESIYNGKF